MTSKFFVQCIIKQLLDSVLVISRIIKVSVRVISLSLRLRLITLTSTLIILDITKTSSNNCLKSDNIFKTLLKFHFTVKQELIYNRPFYSCVLSYLAINASEAGVDLALIQTSLLFSCKCQLGSIRTT